MILPIFDFGVSNDLVMRASIPALAVMWITLIRHYVLAPVHGAARYRWLFGLLLVVGAATPLQEFARSLMLPRWDANMEHNLPNAFLVENNGQDAFPPHYFLPTAWEAGFGIIASEPTHFIDADLPPYMPE